MMVGECYAMRSNLDELCFVRTLSYKDDYYTINRKNGKAIFGRLIDEYRTEQITVYPSGYSFNSCICNTDYMPAKARYYSIDPMTFQKVQKMHDVLNSTLLTLINSFLE